MNQKIYLFVLLVISLLIGSSLSYITVISQEPDIPEEILAEIKNDFYNKAFYQAKTLYSEFESYESVIKTARQFTHQIWQNESQYKPVDYYYHNNVSGLVQPEDLSFNDEYDNELAFSASAYKIAPTAFQEDYQEYYLNNPKEDVNPLTKIDSEMLSLINKSAKLDYIFTKLYSAYPDTLWLYMGFEKGLHRTYPYHNLSRSYDPRLRPWYISSVTGTKDVVIVLDKSGSMEGEIIEEVKAATRKIISNLGQDDRFNVLTFSDDVDQFVDSLEVKSPDTERQLELFLNKTRAGGTTNINEALVKSTSLLGKYGTKENTPVILFLTDGRPSTGITNNDSIIENVRRSNYANAHIITFGIGDDVDYDLMDQIAFDNDGTVIKVNDTQDIDFAMQRYSNFISKVAKKEIVSWGFPIVDAAGQGLIITASSPVYIEEELLGVIAVDLHLADLINNMKSQNKDRENAFLFNVGGISLIHNKFINLEPNKWEELAVRKPIEYYETYNQDFIALKEKAKGGETAVSIINYGNVTKVVAMSPVGSTSMIYGIAAVLEDIINPNIQIKLAQLNINQNSILPGIGSGLLVAIIIFIVVMKSGPKKVQNVINEIKDQMITENIDESKVEKLDETKEENVDE